jgi:TRAP-type C4-dicarboxylate transport system substrate-binding protein
MTPDVLVMSSKAWNSLSAEDRQIFRHAARESRKFMRSQWKSWGEGFRKQAPDLGVTVGRNRSAAARGSIDGPL